MSGVSACVHVLHQQETQGESYVLQQSSCPRGYHEDTSSDAVRVNKSRAGKACHMLFSSFGTRCQAWEPDETTEPKRASVFNSRHSVSYIVKCAGLPRKAHTSNSHQDSPSQQLALA